jgi:hypothetical protein
MSGPLYDNCYHHTRNYGCRYSEIVYKGYRALVLENELIRTTILLDKGSDIFELLYKPKDIDFMWRSPLELNADQRHPVTKELAGGSILDAYEGGWQELLPSISAPSNYKGMGLGFHGEVFSLPWGYQIVEDTPYLVRVRLYVRTRRAPLSVTKTITIRSQTPVLDFEESLRNEAAEAFQFMWGHHPALGIPFLDSNCVIDLPEGAVGQTYQVDFSGNSPFNPDETFAWPYAKDKRGRKIDLSRVMSPDERTAFNVYIKNLRRGWYGVTNLKKKIGFGLTWDIDVFRYLLLWSVYRGFYGFPFYGRTYNIALEPYSSIPDNLDEVIQLDRALKLEAGQEIQTRLRCILYESDRRIRGFTDDDEVVPA